MLTYWIIPSIGFISILIFPYHYSIVIIMLHLITFTIWSIILLSSYLEQCLVHKSMVEKCSSLSHCNSLTNLVNKCIYWMNFLKHFLDVVNSECSMLENIYPLNIEYHHQHIEFP